MYLEIEKLSKEYGDLLAIDHFTSRWEDHEIIGLVGPNGAGKSTLFKIVAGFLEPHQGNIRLNGENVSLGAVAYVPEFPDLFPVLSVWEHFKFISLAYKINHWEQEAQEYLEAFQLTDKKNSLAGELSKGMKQKVMIAISLLRKPSVLLMDEPFSGLDPLSSRELQHRIQRLKSPNRIVLVSSHNLNTIQSICDRVLIMKHGVLLRDQKMSAILNETRQKGFETLEDFFLEVTRFGNS
ncbi:ABC transporter ATP-binding protein [Tindallia californiensis]|uniref:ABC-type multidrug transport system, ATPase component n=1 Tax=Tindallia californiensis TaxID=159292 RepID=A0A1H3QHP4_9FIRM|nr:ABC transporter ATP-binding protein [Tindallia californiensis]SDZ12558.1 ABC-type multidrug transport system, ATPase component [Tindallia californiensis]